MKEKIAEFSRNGILIETTDPQPAVRKNAEIARDWEYASEAAYLYDKAILFKDRFLDPVLLTDRRRLPDPVISFENLRNYNTLATYTLVRNPQGLLYEITFNTEQYVTDENKRIWEFGRWAQMETLLHEQVHLWQQNFGKDPVKPGKPYHNKEFVNKCESLGLHPLPMIGCHVAVADGVFAQLMAELGIPRPDDVPKWEWTKAGGVPLKRDWFRPKKEKGRSSLAKWTCPECGLNVRIGIKGDPELRHDPCEQKLGKQVFFVQPDGLSHVIYKANKG